MPNRIQVFYEALSHSAKCLREQADSASDLKRCLCQTVEQLQSGAWRGQGADAFFVEMSDLVLPAVGRLSSVLHEAGEAVKRISVIFRDAEEEACRCFQGGSTPESDETGSGGISLQNDTAPATCPVGDTACQTSALEQMGINFDPSQWTPSQIEMLYWGRMFSQDYLLDVPGNVSPPNPKDLLEDPCASFIASIFSQTGIFSSRLDVTGVALLYGVLTGQQYAEKLARTFDHTGYIPHNREFSFGTTDGCDGNCIDGPVPTTIAEAGAAEVSQWQSIQPGSVVVHYDGEGKLEFGRYPHVTMVTGWASQSPTGETMLYPNYEAAVAAGVTDPVPYVMDRGIGGPDDPWRGPRPFNDIYNEGVEMGYLSTTSYLIFNMQPESTQP